jgi:beta-lactamase family protein
MMAMRSLRCRTAALAVPPVLVSCLLSGCAGSGDAGSARTAPVTIPGGDRAGHLVRPGGRGSGPGRAPVPRPPRRVPAGHRDGPLGDVPVGRTVRVDSTAGNLLLDQLGGPDGLQAALRGLGDTTTHVDRTEPTLNQAVPGDVRDTSTPHALGADLRRLVLEDVLPQGRQHLLTSWLVGNTTGGPYIRAGVPTGWRVGDKTGNGGNGTSNDIAIAWPASGSPIVVAIMSDRGSADASSDDALIADATRVGVAALR